MKVDPAVSSPVQSQRNRDLRQAAEDLEAVFLAEMLKPMGAAKARESFGGGIGEEQFSTFLLEEEARAVTRTGGIGLAESLFNAMKSSSEATYARR